MCNWQTGKKISSSKMHREKNAKELIPYKSKKVDHVTTKLQSFISTRHANISIWISFFHGLGRFTPLSTIF
jgi:hypothetical protein